MRIQDLGRHALTSCVAIAMLAGCGGSQPPIGAPGAMPQSGTSATRATHGKSWMRPEAKNEDLVYVSNGRNTLRVFSYPKGKPVGVLDVGYPGASCSDSHGNVYISSGPEILEYAHGGTTPINTLNIDYGGSVIACAVDPATGDVAATVAYANQGFYVAIFFGGTGSSENLKDSGLQEYAACVYDDAGNFYVMGWTGAGYGLTELPAGSSDFITLSLSESLAEGALQWDGQYLDIDHFDRRERDLVYQVEVSGSNATIVSSTQLSGHVYRSQPWLFGKTFVAASGWRHNRDMAFWRYPAGGKPIAIVSSKYFSHNSGIFDVTVSVAPSSSRIRR